MINLTAEERKIVENAVEKRSYEFSAGRNCARKCLGGSRVSNFSLLKGKYGQPVWPPGFTGSITHHSGLAFAVTMSQMKGFIGIDFIDLSEQLAEPRSILTPEEMNNKFASNLKNHELLLFSLKESVIKILSPEFMKFIEFKDIEINLKNTGSDITYRNESMDIQLFWFIHSNFAFTLAIRNI